MSKFILFIVGFLALTASVMAYPEPHAARFVIGGIESGRGGFIAGGYARGFGYDRGYYNRPYYRPYYRPILPLPLPVPVAVPVPSYRGFYY